ncbi:MAG: hypothetical protein HY897_05410 [Deltaproteobacteria bacterium]|nr:hypothetical protein [Deltaproteobacteria bacterium]
MRAESPIYVQAFFLFVFAVALPNGCSVEENTADGAGAPEAGAGDAGTDAERLSDSGGAGDSSQPEDSGQSADTGQVQDTGSEDAEAPDIGVTYDAGGTDSGPLPDSGQADADNVDAGHFDAAGADIGHVDAGVSDTGGARPCQTDLDCAFPGYCDPGTGTCRDGECRDEGDCLSGHKCEGGRCVEKTCLESGGGGVACNLFEFCCGENANIECRDPAGQTVDAGTCFEASSPPWCTKCGISEDCPSDAGLDNRCIEFQGKDGGTIGKFCGVPCAKQPDGGPPGQCPRGHECVEFFDAQGNSEGSSCLWMRCADRLDAGAGG